MKKKSAYRNIGSLLLSGLLGQTSIGVSMLSYCLVALVLVVYVSAQIYASALTQDISELADMRGEHKERLNKLTSEYVSLSSYQNVSSYCEDKLGMVNVAENYQRFVVDAGDRYFETPVDLSQRRRVTPDLFGYTFRIVEPDR